jgi:hypothetical protein
MEGRKTPRRKPGRPRKPKPTEVEVEFLISDNLQKSNEEQSATEDIVDPEQVSVRKKVASILKSNVDKLEA